MTRSVSEVFAEQLARGGARSVNKYLLSRGVSKSDRDDIIAAAMLWCWENRDKYSLTTTLETWFMNAIRNAHQSMKRGELPASDESIDNMGRGDETFNRVSAAQAAEVLMGALTPGDRQVAYLTQQGHTRRELIELGYSQYIVDGAHARIKQLRRLLPDLPTPRFVARTPSATLSDDVDDTLSEIDAAIERLDFPPPSGKDCPPCWRCKWYEGLLPDGKRSTRMEIADLEVREAVKNTEARKIGIAQQVRSGT